jgi:hypothetical protein
VKGAAEEEEEIYEEDLNFLLAAKCSMTFLFLFFLSLFDGI